MFSLPIGSPHTPSHTHTQQQNAPQPLQTIPVHVPPISSVCTYLSQAVHRWLKPNELQAILIQLKSCHYQWILPPSPPSSSPFASLSSVSVTPLPLLSLVAPHRPRPGSIFVYSKKHSTRWRKDHYRWQKEERHTKSEERHTHITNATDTIKSSAIYEEAELDDLDHTSHADFTHVACLLPFL